MAGQSVQFERDMVMMMTKLTDLINKQIAAQGTGNSNRRLDLTIDKIAKALGKTPAQLDELNRMFLGLNKSGEELAEHVTLATGATRSTIRKLKLLDEDIAGLSDASKELAGDMDDIGDALEHFDKAAGNMTKAINTVNSSVIELDVHISNLASAIEQEEEELKNLTSTTVDLSEEQVKKKEALEQSIQANREELSAIKLVTQAHNRVRFAQDRMTLAHGQIAAVSLQTFDKMGDFNIALDRVARQNKALSDVTAKAARASALQSAAQIEFSRELDKFGAEYMGYKDALRDASATVPAAMLRMAGMFDDQTKAIKDNLEPEAFAKLRAAIGETKVIASESIRGVDGVKNVQDLAKQSEKLGSPELLDKGNDKLRTAIMTLAQQLEVAGVFNPKSAEDSTVIRDANGAVIGLKKTTELTDAQFKKLASEIASFDKTVDNTAKQLDHLGAVSQTAVGKHYFLMKATGGAAGMLKKFAGDLGTTAVFLGNLRAAAGNVKGAFDFIQDFNMAQVPASLQDVVKTSVSLGVSMQDAVKMMQENKRTLAIQGADVFSDTRNAMGQTFKQLGYNAAQSMGMIGPGIEAAINSGVSVRDPAGLNTYIDGAMKSFKGISGIVNATAEQYLRLNAQLMQDNDIMAVSMGMSKDQQLIYAKSLEEQRNSLVMQGIELEQAQEIVKAREKEKRSKIIGRYRDSALAGAKLQMMGFSGQEAAEFTRIKTVGIRNEQEANFYNDIMKRMTAQEDAERGAGLATGDIGSAIAANAKYDILDDKTGGLRNEQDSYRQLNRAEQNKTAMTKGEAAAAGEKAKGDANLATLGNVVNSVTSILDNVFTKAIWSSTLALVGFSAQLARMGGVSGLVGLGKDAIGGFKGGKGIMGKIVGAGKGLLGMGGGVLATEAAAGAAGVAGAATAGTAATGAAAAGTAGAATLGSKALGLGSKALKFGGKLVKGFGIGAIGGILGDMIGESGDENIAKAKESGDKISGVDLAKSVAGKAASWGATGAAIGSFIPGLGTLVGGGLGALAGGAAGLFSNADNISKWWSQDKKPEMPKAVPVPSQTQAQTQAMAQGQPGTVAATGASINDRMKAAIKEDILVPITGRDAPAVIASPGNTMPGLMNNTASTQKTVNKKSDSKDEPALLQVSDESANRRLEDITKALQEMLVYMKDMSQAATDPIASPTVKFFGEPDRRQIPLASQYISGRQSA